MHTEDTPRSLGSPWPWRLVLGGGAAALYGAAYHFQDRIGPRGQAGCGIACILLLVAAFSHNLRAVAWRTVLCGLGLQVLLALFILRFEVHGLEALDIPDGYAPGRELFQSMGEAIGRFTDFTRKGTDLVFGPLADPGAMEKVLSPQLGPGRGFIFAFAGLPVIIFVSSFFTMLYYLGVLQFIVRMLARAMMYLMGTSGAETLSATANVFMGQTEAPLIVKPYVARMTQSELLALMVGGMATISGGLLVVYAQLGADRMALLATSVMAAPCGLFLAKLLLPETEEPLTRGTAVTNPETTHRNVIDAAAGGASEGLFLALNVAAMLIAFLALLEMSDFLLGAIPTGRDFPEWLSEGSLWTRVGKGMLTLLVWFGCWKLLERILVKRWGDVLVKPGMRWGAMAFSLAAFLGITIWALPRLQEDLSLDAVFSWAFSPLAFLIGVPAAEVPAVADLLGLKLAGNEFVAYQEMHSRYLTQLSPRTIILTTFALTGFANFGSVGIQLGGIGAMAPERRGDLARLGGPALFVGFLATLLNAALAGLLID